MNKMIKKFVTISLIGFVSGVGLADILVSYNTFGNVGTETAEPPASTAANLSATDLSLVGVTAASNGNRFGGNNWAVGNTLNITNDYISLTITPDSGYTFSISDIVVAFDRSGTGPSNFTFRTSFDGFATDLFTPIARTTTGVQSTSNTVSSLNDVGSALEIRLYGYNAGSATGTAGIDTAVNSPNFIISGTVSVVPEPAAVSMLLLGLLGARGAMHRRKKS